MNQTAPTPPGAALDEFARALARLDQVARLVAWGLPVLGLIHAARRVLAAIDRPGLALFDAVYLIGAYTLAGLLVGSLIHAATRWLQVHRSPGGLEHRALVGAASAAQGPSSIPATPPVLDGTRLDLLKEQTLVEIRRTVRSGKWVEASVLLDALADDHLEDPRVKSLHEELRSARESARDEHMAKLDAARKVNDPDRVLELHRFLVPLLEAEARRSLEADLSRWFLRLIHNRLRTGRIQADVVHLAGRIAEALGHTVDGASLHASLPTLRRSAGLCPRCAQPYAGVADACPACLGLGQPPSNNDPSRV
jgi:hypothetical protein